MSREGPSRARLEAGRATVGLAAGLLIALFLGLGGLGPVADSGESDPFKALDLLPPRPPRPAPDFRATAPGGGFVNLADHRGAVVLLNFWATWCRPCRDEMPALERLSRRYRQRGFVVLAISLDANAAVVAPFLRTYGLTLPVGLDPGMSVAERYRVTALPATFLVDQRGEVRASAIGPRDWDSAPAHAVIEAMVGSSSTPTRSPGAEPSSK